MLDDNDWNILSILKDLLEPAASTTKFIQHDKNAPASVIIPFVQALIKQYSKEEQNIFRYV